MKPHELCLLALMLALVMAPATSAYNISFSTVNGATERDLDLYCGVNSTMTIVGSYNTSSTAIPVACDALFVVKPHNTNPLEDPGDWLENTVFPFLLTNLLSLAVGIFLIGLLYMGRR